MYWSGAEAEARGGDDDRVLHGAVLLELLHDLHDRRGLLADGDVDADHVLALLVDDRVDDERVLPVWRSPMISSRWPRPIGIIESMALMPVCSGSLTGWRSTTPGALNSTGRNCVGLDGALVVERAAERVDHAAEQGLADRHLQHAAGALDEVALLDERVLAEQHGADVVLFEVERQAR